MIIAYPAHVGFRESGSIISGADEVCTNRVYEYTLTFTVDSIRWGIIKGNATIIGRIEGEQIFTEVKFCIHVI